MSPPMQRIFIISRKRVACNRSALDYELRQASTYFDGDGLSCLTVYWL